MIQSLAERSVSGDADSVKHTFSSWDNCMAKAYCKYVIDDCEIDIFANLRFTDGLSLLLLSWDR
jgi:hypothetical protein